MQHYVRKRYRDLMAFQKCIEIQYGLWPSIGKVNSFQGFVHFGQSFGHFGQIWSQVILLQGSPAINCDLWINLATSVKFPNSTTAGEMKYYTFHIEINRPPAWPPDMPGPPEWEMLFAVISALNGSCGVMFPDFYLAHINGDLTAFLLTSLDLTILQEEPPDLKTSYPESPAQKL